MKILVFMFLVVMSAMLSSGVAAQSDSAIPAVFYVTEGFDYHIATLNPTTYEATEVCDVADHSLTNVIPGQSPDGRTLALTLFAGNFSVADFTFIPTQHNSFIYLCDLASGSVERLSVPTDSVLDSSPSFSPDGSQLAWLRLTGDSNNLQTEVIVYDRATGTETSIATLEAVPLLGIASDWVNWGPGGIAVFADSNIMTATPDITLYSPEGDVLATHENTDEIGLVYVMHEWALLDGQGVFVLYSQPLAGSPDDRFIVLNPATGMTEQISDSLTRMSLQTRSSGAEPIRYRVNASLGQTMEVGILDMPYTRATRFAGAPDGTGLFVIEASALTQGGLLYFVPAEELGMALGARTFPIVPITLDGVVPGRGGAVAVYWQPDTWRFEGDG